MNGTASSTAGGTVNRALGDGGYDVVVIGAGAGGLNAALVLARARRRVAVVDAGEPRNAPSAHMRGFLSRDGMPPAALLEVGRREVAGYGVDLIDGSVDTVLPAPGPTPAPARFSVRLAGGAVVRARHVVLATGLRDELPELPGVRERWGKDVLFCPYCHGYEFRDRAIGVLGTHPGAVGHALLLRQWSADVVLFSHTLEPSGDERARLAARGVRVEEGEVKRLAVEDGTLRGVELAEGRAVPCEAAFLVPGMVPRDGMLADLGCARDGNGWLVTDRAGRTSVPGVWAVGNVADPRAQVVTAAGTGAAAAFALNLELVEEDVERSLPVPVGQG
ncbi:NAD(P)/FAD-dependent oxidoreductase [Streptomyces sp. NPDC048172]|uniref:NAD(P)/FAD-dependent oxidoreductase n=1 Tax=Streptomyces sp. NPDC048172 TaxID=3365505 RepID=UPI0037117BE8